MDPTSSPAAASMPSSAASERSDAELLQAARAEPEAFAVFYRRHVRALSGGGDAAPPPPPVVTSPAAAPGGCRCRALSASNSAAALRTAGVTVWVGSDLRPR